MSITAAYGSQVSTATIGHLRHRLNTTLAQLLLVHTASSSILLVSSLQMDRSTVGMASPSATYLHLKFLEILRYFSNDNRDELPKNLKF